MSFDAMREPTPILDPRPPRRRDQYRRYRITQAALPAFLIAYILIASWHERVSGQGEIFPFASWSLFSFVPNISHDFSIRVLSLNGSALTPPVFFEDSTALFESASKHGARVLIDLLGQALAQGEVAEAERIRDRFEHLCMPGMTAVRYELVARVYDPLERFRTGRLRAVRTVRTFETRRP
jgi:hypothetical protein